MNAPLPHPSISLTPKVGIGVLIYTPQGHLLLGKRLSLLGQGTWAPPGGHLEYRESLEECALRETLEETGLHILNPQFVGLTNDIYPHMEKHYVSIFMKVTLSEPAIPTLREPDKIARWEWFAPDNLPTPLFAPLEMFLKGKGYGAGHR